MEGKQIAETVIGGTTQYVHTDALGSPVAHTSQAGSELNRTKFEPYGYTAAGTKPGATAASLITTGSAIGFTGHVNDPDTDLVYMQQRYYDPIAGRFLSIDPVTADANTGSSFNRYAYAKNNPHKHIDPDGRDPYPWDSQPLIPAPHAQFQAMLTSVFGGGERAATPAETSTVTKSTLTATYVEVSRTTIEGGGGSTYVGVRLTPGLAFQTTVEQQAKLGDGGSGVTVKTSASAGIGLLGVTGSLQGTAGTNGVGVQASGGVVGAANNKGGIWGVRPPTIGVGITIKDKKTETEKKSD